MTIKLSTIPDNVNNADTTCTSVLNLIGNLPQIIQAVTMVSGRQEVNCTLSTEEYWQKNNRDKKEIGLEFSSSLS